LALRQRQIVLARHHLAAALPLQVLARLAGHIATGACGLLVLREALHGACARRRRSTERSTHGPCPLLIVLPTPGDRSKFAAPFALNQRAGHRNQTTNSKEMRNIRRTIAIGSVVAAAWALPPDKAQAQAQGYGTLGEGTVNMGTNGQSPYNIKTSGRRVQFIILASDLRSTGGVAGNIQRLAWNIATVGTGAVNGYTIKMRHLTQDHFASSNFYTTTTGTTTVYTGNYLPAGTGFQDINFTTNFNWNGTDNILVEVCWSSGSGTAGSIRGDQRYWAMATSNVISGAGCGQNGSGRTHTLPQMRLYMNTGPAPNGCLSALGNGSTYQYPATIF